MPIQEPILTRPRRRGVTGLIRSDDVGEQFRHDMKAQLRSGKMPDFMFESSYLIPEGETQEADHVITYIRGLFDRLCQKNDGQSCPPLKIFLADQPGFLLGVFPKSETPIVLVGLGFLDLLVANGFSEDHLVGCLGHEKFHLKRNKLWEDLDNGRPEESFADVFGVYEAFYAGYNPKAQGEFFQLIAGAEGRDGHNTHWSELAYLFDEHPPAHTRARNCDVAIGTLQMTEREMERDHTPLPEDVVSLLDGIRCKTRVEKWLEARNYAAASPSKKVDLLGEYVKELFQLETHTYLRKLRLEQCEEVFGALLSSEPDEEAQKAAHAWFEYFMKHSPKVSPNEIAHNWALVSFLEIMGWCQPIEYLRRDLKPEDDRYWKFEKKRGVNFIPDEFKRLQTESRKFINATTREEAVRAGKALQQAEIDLEDYWPGLRILELFRETMDGWPQRWQIEDGIKKGKFYRLPWESHARWATGEGERPGVMDGKKDSLFIAKLALRLGAHDDRFPGYEPSEFYTPQEYKIEALIKNEQGYIIGIKPSEEEQRAQRKAEKIKALRQRFEAKTAAQLFRKEFLVQKRRDRLERKLIKEIDWSGLESDFWGFVKNNAEHIRPALTNVPGEHVFAREFVRRFESLVTNDPDNWQPIWNVFFSGVRPETRKERKSREEEEHLKLEPYSLPQMLENFKYTYHEGAREKQLLRGKLSPKHPMGAVLADLADIRREETHNYYDHKKFKQIRKTIPVPVVPASREMVAIELKADPSHPFVEAIIGLSREAQPLREKLRLFYNFHVINRNAKILDDLFIIHPRRITGDPQPDSQIDFIQLGENLKCRSLEPELLEYVTIPYELLLKLRRIQSKSAGERYSLSEFSFNKLTHSFDVFHHEGLEKRLHKEFTLRVNRQIIRNMILDLRPEVPLNELIERFYINHNNNYFNEQRRERTCWDEKDGWDYIDTTGCQQRIHPAHSVFYTRPEIEKKYEDYIKCRILELPLHERLEPLTHLMRLSIRRPEHREWAIEAWSDAAAFMLGKDYDAADYQANTNKFISKALRDQDSVQALPCMIKLLNKIEAQNNISMVTKQRLIDKYGREFLESDVTMRIVESTIDLCAHDRKLRPALLKYISEPLTPTGTREFLALLKEHAESYEFHKLFDGDSLRRRYLTQAQQIAVFDFMHHNFQAAPFEIQTLYLDRLLFPPKATVKEYFKDVVEFIYDKVLPLDQRFAPEMREAISVYLDNCPPELRRITISALLASSQQQANGNKLRPGQIISLIATRLAPAGGILLQAAHSALAAMDLNDSDLIQLRDDIKDSKTAYAFPFRWDVFERLNDILSQDKIDKIGHVGPVLGSGTTAFVVKLEMGPKDRNGLYTQRTALKAMRKNVLPIGDLQLERFSATFSALAERHDYYDFLPGLVSHARTALRIATNGYIAGEQIRYAEGRYNPLTVTAGARKIHFHVARFLEAGDEYVETELVEGPHFNDLGNGSKSATDFRFKVACGLETADNCHLLETGRVDEDKHGGQSRIDAAANTDGAINESQNILLLLFDFGALPYDLEKNRVTSPSAEERRALGHLMGEIVNAVTAGHSPKDILAAAITEDKWGIAAPYLVGIQRSLLGSGLID